MQELDGIEAWIMHNSFFPRTDIQLMYKRMRMTMIELLTAC